MTHMPAFPCALPRTEISPRAFQRIPRPGTHSRMSSLTAVHQVGGLRPALAPGPTPASGDSPLCGPALTPPHTLTCTHPQPSHLCALPGWAPGPAADSAGWTWCSGSEPGVLSAVEAREWSPASGLGGVWAGGLLHLPLGRGSGEPSMATLPWSLCWPSWAVRSTGPSLGEVDRVSSSMSSLPISSVGLCNDGDQQPAWPGSIRALPGHIHCLFLPLAPLLPDQAQTYVGSHIRPGGKRST